MKLTAETDFGTLPIEFRRDGDRIAASIEGREYELEASEPEPGVFLFKHDGRVFEAIVTRDTASSSGFNVSLKGREHSVNVIDPKKLRGSGRSDALAEGFAEIKTAMPGKVVRVLAAEGDAVEKGDGIVVVEAMKMQNELKSPIAGVVKTLNAVEGATVSAGDVLATIE